MGDFAVAAVLATTILLASMVSIEAGISVALIELFAGVVVGNAFNLDVPGWLAFIGSFAGIVPDVPRRRRGRRAAVPSRLARLDVDRPRFVLRPVRGRRAARVLRPRLEPAAGRDRGHRALDDEPRGRLLGAGGDGPQPDDPRQAPDGRHLRDRLRHRGRARRPVHHADRLDRARSSASSLLLVVGTAGARAMVLRPLREPDHRAGDQARLRRALPADVARRPGALTRGPPGLRARARDELPLPSPPPRAGAPARGRVRLPDAVLLPQGRDERLGRRALGEPRDPGPALRREARAEVRRASTRSRAATWERMPPSRRC